jgi:hypothetical protein
VSAKVKHNSHFLPLPPIFYHFVEKNGQNGPLFTPKPEMTASYLKLENGFSEWSFERFQECFGDIEGFYWLMDLLHLNQSQDIS